MKIIFLVCSIFFIYSYIYGSLNGNEKNPFRTKIASSIQENVKNDSKIITNENLFYKGYAELGSIKIAIIEIDGQQLTITSEGKYKDISVIKIVPKELVIIYKGKKYTKKKIISNNE